MPKTFDINQYNVIVGNGITPQNYAEGEDVVQFEPDGNDWSYVTGADGKSSRSKLNKDSGILTIKLQRTSPTNNRFADLRKTDLTTPGGAEFAVLVKDTIGQTVLKSNRCSFVKLPSAPDGTGVAEREWQIKMLEGDFYVGGNE